MLKSKNGKLYHQKKANRGSSSESISRYALEEQAFDRSKKPDITAYFTTINKEKIEGFD